MKKYTLDELRKAYDQYDKLRILAILSNGEWTEKTMLPGVVLPNNINATRADWKLYKDKHSFIKFLEEIWQSK
jgi:hypothetical protein